MSTSYYGHTSGVEDELIDSAEAIGCKWLKPLLEKVAKACYEEGFEAGKEDGAQNND